VASKASSRVRGRAPGPVRLAFTRAAQDWYYGLIPFSVMNLVWLALVLTVVGGPPATAAMLGVARDAAIGYGPEPSTFFIYLKQYFWRAWGLGIVTLVGTIILVTDIRFYADALKGNPLLVNTGVYFLLYVLFVWLEVLLIAWPLLVNQPQMSIRDVVRNAAILTLRTPGASLGLALAVLFLSVLSLFLAFLAAMALAAFLSLLAQHYIHVQAPVLANFPPPVGEVAAQAQEEVSSGEEYGPVSGQ
jgi:uncharacterized membrane protein YesL